MKNDNNENQIQADSTIGLVMIILIAVAFLQQNVFKINH